MVAHSRQDGEGNPAVYMLPAPQERMDMNNIQEPIPESVLQYCKTAQEIYFSGNLMATNVLIKTAMETIFEDFLPIGNSRGDLSMMIRDSISTINHNEPLAKLSSSTKKMGDLHALFKKHHGTDQVTADAMMQLLETLIMYLYILPSRFRELEERFVELKVASDARDLEESTAKDKTDAEQRVQGGRDGDDNQDNQIGNAA